MVRAAELLERDGAAARAVRPACAITDAGVVYAAEGNVSLSLAHRDDRLGGPCTPD